MQALKTLSSWQNCAQTLWRELHLDELQTRTRIAGMQATVTRSITPP